MGWLSFFYERDRGGICQCRHCRQQCKIFASGVNFSIFTHFCGFSLLKLLKLGEIDGVKFSACKSGGLNFLTNSMSGDNNPRNCDFYGFVPQSKCGVTFKSYFFVAREISLIMLP